MADNYHVKGTVFSLRHNTKHINISRSFLQRNISSEKPCTWPCIPTHCRCSWLLWHLVTLNDTHTHTFGRIPLDEGSVRHRELITHKNSSYERRTPMPRGYILTS